jgi:hypothetical protein
MSDNNSSERQQEVTYIKNDVSEYSISKARVIGELVVIKVLKTDKRVAKYEEAINSC